jgi:hypothetical protein
VRNIVTGCYKTHTPVVSKDTKLLDNDFAFCISPPQLRLVAVPVSWFVEFVGRYG